MRKQINDMSAAERRTKRVQVVQVLSVRETESTVLTLVKLPNGQSQVETLCCSFASELEPLEYIDIERYLVGSSKIGTRILGMTPAEYIPK